MKRNILNIFYLALSMVVVLSCDPDKVDDGFMNDLKVYTQFQRSSLVIPVLEGLDNSQAFTVQVSTPVPTTGISVAVDEGSEALEGVDFTLDTSQLVFSGDQIEGSIIIDPVFETALLEGKTLLLNLVSTDEDVEVLGNSQIEIVIEKQCPVASDYMTGAYTLSDVQATVGPNNGSPNFGGTVTVSIGSSSTSRVFDAAFLPGFGTPQATLEISLVCNTLFFNTANTVGLSCDGVTNLGYAPDSSATMTYSDDDDSSFVINYIEDPTGSCGGPFNSSFMLTKVN